MVRHRWGQNPFSHDRGGGHTWTRLSSVASWCMVCICSCAASLSSWLVPCDEASDPDRLLSAAAGRVPLPPRSPPAIQRCNSSPDTVLEKMITPICSCANSLSSAVVSTESRPDDDPPPGERAPVGLDPETRLDPAPLQGREEGGCGRVTGCAPTFCWTGGCTRSMAPRTAVQPLFTNPFNRRLGQSEFCLWTHNKNSQS